MERINQLLNEYAGKIINNLKLAEDNRFSSRVFIWAFMQEYESEYVDMLNEARNSNHESGIFLKLHTHIGNYLEHNAAQLGIDKVEGERETSISPLGHSSSTQIWIRRS